MVEDSKDQEFILKKKKKNRSSKKFFTVEINQNELISKKHKKVSTILNYIENVFILASIFTGYVSTSLFLFAS